MADQLRADHQRLLDELRRLRERQDHLQRERRHVQGLQQRPSSSSQAEELQNKQARLEREIDDVGEQLDRVLGELDQVLAQLPREGAGSGASSPHTEEPLVPNNFVEPDAPAGAASVTAGTPALVDQAAHMPSTGGTTSHGEPSAGAAAPHEASTSGVSPPHEVGGGGAPLDTPGRFRRFFSRLLICLPV